MLTLPGFDLDAFVAATLAEDLGTGGDITSTATIPPALQLTAVMASRDAIRVAGLPIAAAFFTALDPAAAIASHVEDGADAAPGDPLGRAFGAQHRPASLRHRHADPRPCRRDRRQRRNPARHAQDDSWPQGVGEICRSDGWRN